VIYVARCVLPRFMIPLLRTACCFLVAQAHRLAGRFWFRVGRVERSRDHFERVLELKGDDFVAYVFLGRLAYSIGDYAGWRREFEHARRTAPERYARLKNPFDLFEPRSAGAIREETGERATWRTVKLHNAGLGSSSLFGGNGALGNGILGSGFRGNLGNGPVLGHGAGFGGYTGGLFASEEGLRVGPFGSRDCPDGKPLRRYGDDFANDGERLRFRELPPIEHEDVAGADLERLIDELTR
jgi:hypothetical protein